MGLPHLSLACHTCLRTLSALLTHLYMLRTLRPLLHGEALRTLLHARHRHALLALLETRRRLMLRSRCGISAAAATASAAAAAVHGSLLAPAATASITVIAMRPCECRGCDRQRGYSGCEKNPGHKKSPSNGENGPFATPFQPLNGWNQHLSALG
ncbi:MAG TPA: hypothetical protein VGH84_01175 [Steroidobacteraceae bacterium]|jgi:hypothetical protein